MKIAGILTILLGIALALFVGVYLLFAGGLIQLLDGIDAHNNPAKAWGIVRMIFSCIVTIVIIVVAAFSGWSLIDEANRRKRRQRNWQRRSNTRFRKKNE